MAEYIDRTDLITCTDIRVDGSEFTYVSYDEIQSLSPADVVEREKIDKAIEEIEQTLYVDSLIFGELIDFKDGKISADDVIEEFNRVTRKEVLEILKRNMEE